MMRDIISIILGHSKLMYDEKKHEMDSFIFGPNEFASMRFGDHFASLSQHPRKMAVAMRYIGEEMDLSCGSVITGVPRNVDDLIQFSGPVDGHEPVAYPVMIQTVVHYLKMNPYRLPTSHLNDDSDIEKNFDYLSDALPAKWRQKLQSKFQKVKNISEKKTKNIYIKRINWQMSTGQRNFQKEETHRC